MFVNGDINPSPDLLPATYEGILLLEREGKKREENKERERVRGAEYVLCFLLADQSEMSINKVIVSKWTPLMSSKGF